jgi:hypothetical protein
LTWPYHCSLFFSIISMMSSDDTYIKYITWIKHIAYIYVAAGRLAVGPHTKVRERVPRQTLGISNKVNGSVVTFVGWRLRFLWSDY